MQISLKDHGPRFEKVTIAVDGLVVVFPTGSYHGLVDLLTRFGATAGPNAGKGESDWELDVDLVRSQAFQLERESLMAALQESEAMLRQQTEKIQGEADRWRDEYNRVTQLLSGAVAERQSLYTSSWWRRLRWVFQTGPKQVY